MSTELTYEEAVRLLDLVQGSGSAANLEAAWANWGQTATTQDMVDALKASGWKDISSAKVRVVEPASGGIGGYVGEFPVSYNSPVNSNELVRGTVKTPINTTAEVISERSVMSAKVGLREAGKFAIGSVVPAVVATGWGITLGKKIDSALYNLDPDYWDSRGMSSLNPETWNSITTGYDGVAGTLFDLVFGLDGDKTQAYLDEDAAVYLSQYLDQLQWFVPSTEECDIESIKDELSYPNRLPDSFDLFRMPLISLQEPRYPRVWRTKTGTPKGVIFAKQNQVLETYWASHTPFSIGFTYGSGSETVTQATQYTINGETVYGIHISGGASAGHVNTDAVNTLPTTQTPTETDVYYSLTFGTIHSQGDVPGVSDQDGAQLPDSSTWSTPQATKDSLQQQYPQLWDGAKHYDYVDENGNNKTKTLIPINLPDAQSPFDTQPTSGNRSQTDPMIDPNTATDDLLKTITDIITSIITPNPPTTGSGDSPVVPVPAGSASSLWKIYNPTQAQIDSFGSWLWSSNFVEQIKKLFNDPMQAIIGVHKVFATPSIGGTATIKVGYLDSGVSSNWVDNQYTTINCGTIHLSEFFGNVFDYSPYTKVSLYLPFIGIVDLDVADVMRSSINVKYHVDVLSGACLADVKVSRDSANAVLYQYSGSAIVTYPVSSGNYMGMVAGTLSVAAGLAGTILSGGALAPALVGGAVGMSHLHTDVSHSGGFSGCAGAMAGKKPYLIISRPQTAMADSYGHFTGHPANSHVLLNSCSGFTKVKSVYVGTMQSATDEEKNMIEAQLKAGVLI